MENEQKDNTGTKSKFFNIFNSKSALLLGVLITLAGVQNPSLFAAGLSVIIGTLAYKSAKNRKLGVTKPSTAKQILEIVGLILIVLAVAWQNDLKRIIVEDPFPNIFIPAWLITAYLTVVFGNYFSFNGNKKKRIGAIIGAFIAVFFILFFALYSIPIKEYFLSSGTQTTNTQSQSQNQWQEFSSTIGQFTVLLPSYPTYEPKDYQKGVNASADYHQDLYSAKGNGVSFSVEKLTFSNAVDFSSNSKVILEALVNALLQKSGDNKIISSEFTNYQGNEAIDFLVQNNNVYIKGRIILSGQNIYRLLALYESENLSSADYDKFVNSFELK